MENEYNYWHIGCVVTLPGYSDTSYLKAVNKNIIKAFEELLKTSELELKNLKDKSVISQQKLFEYGSKNKNWTEAH